MSKKTYYLLAFLWAGTLLMNAMRGDTLVSFLNILVVLCYLAVPVGWLILHFREIRKRRQKYNEFRGAVKSGGVEDFEKEAKEVIDV